MDAIPVFAPDLHRQPTRDAAMRYVAGELRRVQASGPLSLTALLAGATDGAADLALVLIADGRDPDGVEIVPPGYQVTLRLREGAVPPERDPQGRKLDSAKVGKVLVCKLRNVPRDGAQRVIDERARRDLYQTTEVTHTARAYRLGDAVTILRQWGVLVAPEIDRQIVEEVLPTAPTKGKG